MPLIMQGVVIMKEKTFSKDAILVLIGAFCYMSCSIMAMPIMSGFTETLGGGGVLMGLMSGMMYFVSLCMRPVAGNLADKLKKANLTLGGAFLMLISNIAYVFAPNIAFLTVARVVNGIGYACCTVSMSTWLSMLVPRDKVGKAMGLYGTMQAISMAISGKIALSISNAVDYRMAFAVSSAFALITLITSLMVSDKGIPVAKENGCKKKVRIFDINVLPIALIIMLFTIPYNATQAFIEKYVERANIGLDAGWFITMYAIFLIALRLGFRNYFDKIPYKRFLFISLASSVVSILSLNFMNTYVVMGIGALCMAGGYGIMCSVSQATAISLVGPENRGVANGTYYMGFDLGMAMGPFVGGVLYDNLDIHIFYPMLLLCSALAFVVYIVNRKKLSRV